MSRAAAEDAEAAVAVPATDELWPSPPTASPVDTKQPATRCGRSRVRRWLHDAFRYSGPGWLFSIVFVDPGNLFADIQSGSGYRYAQLWVVWWSQWAGYFIGWLCVGFVFHGDGATDLSRAQRNFYRRPPWSRYVVWALLELIVMGTDISMVIGFAFGVNILTGLPVWAGALLSGLSTVMVLATQLLGFHVLELMVTALLLALGILLLVALIKSGADVGALFFGWAVPTFSSGNSVYDAMDMVGTVVGPHNPYLQTGVLLAHYAALGVRAEMLKGQEPRTTADAADTGGGECSPAETSERTAWHGKQDSDMMVDVHDAGDAGSADHRHSPAELNVTATEDAIQTTAPPAHGVWEVESDSRASDEAPSQRDVSSASTSSAGDVAATLKASKPACNTPPSAASERKAKRMVRIFTLEMLAPVFFSFLINLSMIAITAEHIYPLSAAKKREIGLYNFCDYIPFQGACVTWSLALSAAGLAASAAVSLSGNYVMSGFIDMRLPLWLRACITRALAILPALIISATTVNKQTVNNVIGVVNAFLTFMLPLVLVPLMRIVHQRRPLHWAPLVAGWFIAVLVVGLNTYTLYASSGGMLGQYAYTSPVNAWTIQANILEDVVIIAYYAVLLWLTFA